MCFSEKQNDFFNVSISVEDKNKCWQNSAMPGRSRASFLFESNVPNFIKIVLLTYNLKSILLFYFRTPLFRSASCVDHTFNFIHEHGNGNLSNNLISIYLQIQIYLTSWEIICRMPSVHDIILQIQIFFTMSIVAFGCLEI